MEFKNAAIYVRVSTERQAQEGYSIKAQKTNLINFATNNKFKIYDVYSDEGISGKSIKERPSVKRLIQDIKDKKIDILLIQKFDRLTRNISDTDDFIKLFQKYDIDVWSISDGKVDVDSSNGKFMTLLKGLFAQHERELTAERIKIAFAQKAKQGYTLCCGCAPYGYLRQKGNKIIIIDKEESNIVKKIFEMYLNNNTFSQIAKTLNIEGVPTKNKGKKINIIKDGIVVGERKLIGVWTPKTIRLILSNPVYIGKVRYGIGRKDYYIGNGNHEPIIGEEIWKKTQEKISKIKTKIHTNRPKDDVYFCGTLTCGECGRKMTPSRTNGKLKKDGTKKMFNAYRCPNKEKKICNSRYVSHKKVEEAFIDFLKKIDKFDNIDNETTKDKSLNLEETNNIKKIIKNKRAKQKEVMDLYITEKIDYIQFKYMSNELNNIIIENEKKLIELERDYNQKNNINKLKISRHIADHWKLLKDKEKLMFLSEFVDNIIIVNRDVDRYKGKPEILNVDFF